MTFRELARRTADRYSATSRLARNFALGKLTTDPVYESALELLPDRGTLLDIGCGQGLMLALAIESGKHFDRLVGIETRPRMTSLARAAVGSGAEIRQADVRTMKLERFSVVLMFDVLQAMAPQEQESLIETIARVLEPNGVILIRDGDPSAGWRFNLVRFGNRFKSFLNGTWRPRLHYLSRDQWLATFQRMGLSAEVCPTPTKNPLGNTLYKVRK